MYIYLLNRGDDASHTKVGITGNPNARLKAYQTSDPNRSYRYRYIKKTIYAPQIERTILLSSKEAGWKTQNEWIKMDASILEGMIDDELLFLLMQRQSRDG